eukprot:499944_1
MECLAHLDPSIIYPFTSSTTSYSFIAMILTIQIRDLAKTMGNRYRLIVLFNQPNQCQLPIHTSVHNYYFYRSLILSLNNPHTPIHPLQHKVHCDTLKMSAALAALRYRPTPRDYTFEVILYLLEKGPSGMLLINLVLTYVMWSLVPGLSARYLNLVLIYALIPLSIGVVFVNSMVYNSKKVSAEAWENVKCKMPDWTNEADTGVTFNDKSLLSTYKNSKIPMDVAIELYFHQKIDFTDTKRVFFRSNQESFAWILLFVVVAIIGSNLGSYLLVQ